MATKLSLRPFQWERKMHNQGSFPPISISVLFGGWYLDKLRTFTSSALHHDNSSLVYSRLLCGSRSLLLIYCCHVLLSEIAASSYKSSSTSCSSEKVLSAPLAFVFNTLCSFLFFCGINFKMQTVLRDFIHLGQISWVFVTPFVSNCLAIILCPDGEG